MNKIFSVTNVFFVIHQLQHGSFFTKNVCGIVCIYICQYYIICKMMRKMKYFKTFLFIFRFPTNPVPAPLNPPSMNISTSLSDNVTNSELWSTTFIMDQKSESKHKHKMMNFMFHQFAIKGPVGVSFQGELLILLPFQLSVDTF